MVWLLEIGISLFLINLIIMKLYLKCLFFCAAMIVSSCSKTEAPSADDPEIPVEATPVMFADFETEENTPYFFRFGNKGSQKYEDYLPRWKYGYEVIANPVKDTQNSSANVLQYCSMEAQNYGIKFRFQSSLDVKDVKGIRLKIYQSDNVIGKQTWNNMAQAVQQKIAVKLLAKVNTVNDFRQEAGQILYNDVQDFVETGKWLTYTFLFSEQTYPLAAEQLPEGIQGIAIMPTYEAKVTLSEDDMYTCYIDDIEILK